ACDLVDEPLERVRAAHAEEAAAVAVGVDVRDELLAQLRCVVLREFRGAEQTGLLRIPAGVDDRALRAEAVLYEHTEGARLFHERDHAAQRIRRTEHP